jgi:hypothetical protein
LIEDKVWILPDQEYIKTYPYLGENDIQRPNDVETGFEKVQEDLETKLEPRRVKKGPCRSASPFPYHLGLPFELGFSRCINTSNT